MKIYPLIVEVGGRRGTFYAVADSVEEAINETKMLILMAVGMVAFVKAFDVSDGLNEAGKFYLGLD